MTVAGLAALALGLGAAMLLGSHFLGVRWRRGLGAGGVVGLVVLLVGTWSLPLDQTAQIGNETLQSTGYLRLLLMLAATSGATLAFCALALRRSAAVGSATMIWCGAAAIGLAMVSPLPAVLVLTTGSVIAVLTEIEVGGPNQAVVVARGLRAIAVAGFLVILAIPWADLAATGLRAGISDAGAPPSGAAVGLAFLAGAGGVAVRSGAVPVHLWSGRLAERLPVLGVPVTFAWGPGALAVVLLGWMGPGILDVGLPLPLERAIVVGVAVASLIFGALAAVLHDDLEHAVRYSLVTDAGVVLLGVGALSADAWAPTRLWIVTYLVAKSALAAWATSVSATFGTSRIVDLGGWARRSPLLGAGLVLITISVVGIPGLAAFDARSRLIGLALTPPFDLAAWVGVVASVGVYLRLLIVGIRMPSAAVALAERVLPGWPGGRPTRPWSSVVRQLGPAWELNRIPGAAVAVLALAVVGLAVAAGGLHATGASAGPPPGFASVEEAPGESASPFSSPFAPAVTAGSSSPGTSGTAPPGGAAATPGPASTSPGATVAPSASGAPSAGVAPSAR